MEVERDNYGVSVEAAERMQQVMLSLLYEAGQAKFPHDLVGDLNAVRLCFVDEFERKFPDYGKGRAIWR